MSRRRRQGTDFVEPDLPITPMLDMSFQLLSFFIMTFQPAPTEGQIAMTLPPPEKGAEDARIIPDITRKVPTKYIATVTSTDLGQIAGIRLTEEGSPDIKGKQFGGTVRDVGDFLRTCQKLVEDEAAKRAEDPERPLPKLTLEIANKLLQEHVMQVFDAAVQAGFKDVAPVPIDKKER
jgi:biopolymer transport protein ExbD